MQLLFLWIYSMKFLTTLNTYLLYKNKKDIIIVLTTELRFFNPCRVRVRDSSYRCHPWMATLDFSSPGHSDIHCKHILWFFIEQVDVLEQMDTIASVRETLTSGSIRVSAVSVYHLHE